MDASAEKGRIIPNEKNKITYRDAPVDIKPLQAKIDALEEDVATLKSRADIVESEVEKLK